MEEQDRQFALIEATPLQLGGLYGPDLGLVENLMDAFDGHRLSHLPLNLIAGAVECAVLYFDLQSPQ